MKKYVSEIVLNSDVHLAFNYEFISSQLTNFVWKVIEKYSEKLIQKKQIVVANKLDITKVKDSIFSISLARGRRSYQRLFG